MSGRQRAGAHRRDRTSPTRACGTLASSTRFAPEPVRAPRKRRSAHCLQPRAGHRLRRDAPPVGCEGASGSVSRVVGAASPGRKQQKVNAIRRRAGSPPEKQEVGRGDQIACRDTRVSRVRPDSVLCCIVQRLTGRPVIPLRSHAQARGRRRNRSRERKRAIEVTARRSESRSKPA